jgi:hypothetical protein
MVADFKIDSRQYLTYSKTEEATLTNTHEKDENQF